MGYWWKRVLITIGLFLVMCVVLFILGWTAVVFSNRAARAFSSHAGVAVAAVPVVCVLVLAGWLSGQLVHSDQASAIREEDHRRRTKAS